MATSLHISLPRSVREWVDKQTAEGGYATTDEFVCRLLQDARDRQIRERIDATLIEAIDSGESTPMTSADWKAIRREGRERLAARERA